MFLFYLLILIMPLTEHPFWGTSVGGVTLIKFLGVACALYGIAHMAVSGRVPKFFKEMQVKFFVLLFGIVVISYATSKAVYEAVASPLATYVSLLMLFFVTMAVVDTRARLRKTVLVSFGSIAFASLYLIREWQRGVAAYGISYRPGWVTGDANYFALCVVLLYPLAVFTFLNPQKRFDKWYAGGCLGLIAIAMMLTASRGGFIGLLLGGLFMLKSSKSKLKLTLVTVGLMAVALFLVPSSTLQRITDPNASDKQSSDYRLQLWTAGWRMLAENPIRGVGVGHFGDYLSSYGAAEAASFHVPHNTYLSIGAEMGFPGLLAFIAMLGFSLRSLSKLRKKARAYDDTFILNIGTAIEAGLLGAAASIFFLSADHSKPLWFLVALSAVLPQLLNKQPQAEAEVVEPLPIPSAFEPIGARRL
jgi:putative inorganic carbon (hco3(-)) transporter